MALALSMALGGIVVTTLPATALAQTAQAQQQFSIPAGSLRDALDALASQSGITVLYSPELVAGKTTRGLSGRHPPAEALRRLLQGSGLEAQDAGGLTFTLRQAPAQRAAPAPPEAPPSRARPQSRAMPGHDERDVVGMPAMLVQGARTLNMDIARTRDDPQPYVVFEREIIEQSGARSLEDFLRLRLPQNTQGQTNDQSINAFGNLPQINLRGLGTGQTLLLVDGRRLSPTATTSVAGPAHQPDINGIPLSAIERIEVLPTTASGIYGGSATGGVINIITRRDYSGLEVKLSYGNTFDTDVARRRIDINGGFSLADGRTTVALAGSFSDANALRMHDRGFYERGVERVLETNPAQFFGSFWAGSTANIRSATGAPLTLRGSNASLGSPITYLPAGYAGVDSDGGAALLANAGSFNLELGQSAGLIGGGNADLLAQPTVSSLHGTLRHTFTDRLEGFLDLGAAENDSRGMTNRATGSYVVAADAPTNPFNESVIVLLFTTDTDGVSRTVSKTERAATGLIYKLPGEWMGTTEYTWNKAHFEFSAPAGLAPTFAAAVNQGLVDLFRDPVDLSAYVLDDSLGPRTLKPFVTTQTALSTRLSGPLFTLPGGNSAMLNTLIERREDRFRDAAFQNTPGVATIYPSRSQTVDSLYLEATFPFVGEKNARPGVQAFDLQLSARHDRYEQDGSTGAITGSTPIERVRAKSDSTNPTVGLRYAPVQDVMLRASFGTGFMPPPVNQLAPNAPIITSTADPRRGGQTATFEWISGGNPDLQAEESESWSVGAVFKPRFLPGLRLSLDYFRLDKTDGISTLPVNQILQLEEYLPDRVVRAPAEPGDPWGVGQIVRVDATALNLSTVEIEAVDMALDYEHSLGDYGSLSLFAIGSWQIHNRTQANEIAPVQELVGAGFANPQKFKGNAGLIWRKEPWTVGWYSRYYHSYQAGNISQGGDGSVSSQLFHDLNITYRTPVSSGGRGLARWISGMEYQFGILNVFDTWPAFDAASLPRYYSLLGDPRLRSYELSVKVNF